MFAYFVEHPELCRNYYEAMAHHSATINGAILDAYDFSSISKLVDVAGGYGTLFAAILKANPTITHILYQEKLILFGHTVLTLKPLFCR